MKFTCSRAKLLSLCQFPFRQDAEWPDEGPSRSRDEGSRFHAWMAAYINRRDLPAVVPDGEYARWLAAKEWVDRNATGSWLAEAAFAYDPVAYKSRLLGVDIGREYRKHGAHSHEVCGTLDLLSLEADCAVVYEFGTGRDMTDKWEQALLQGVLAARAFGAERARVQMVRFDEVGAHPYPAEELDVFRLADIELELFRSLVGVELSQPKPGAHCVDLHCPHRTVCPATQEVVEQVIPADALVPSYRMVPQVQSEEHAAWLVSRVKILLEQGEAISSALKAYARERDGIRLPDGKVWCEGFRRMSRLNMEELEKLARAKGATDEDIAMCFVSKQESSGFRARKPAKGEAA